MPKPSKWNKILQMCSGCPKLMMKCPGLTERDKKEGGKCNTYTEILMDGKKYGMEIDKTGELAKYIREGHKIIINSKK